MEAENSEDFGDGSMIFNDEIQKSNEKKKVKQAINDATGNDSKDAQFA